MAKIFEVLPEVAGEEMMYLQNLVKDMDNETAHRFAAVYRNRRREPMLILVTAIIGFFGIAGIHRFLIGDIGLGILYIFTAGLCFIGTIVDLVNHQRLAFEYNRKVADEVMLMFR